MTTTTSTVSKPAFSRRSVAFILAGALCVAAALAFSLMQAPAAYADSDAHQAAAIGDSADNAVQAEGTTLTTQKPSATISPNSEPCDGSSYTKKSKHFWLLKSYMVKFQKSGGGTLTLKKGTYNLPTSIQVPSNVTIVFESGVVIKKTKDAGPNLTPNSPLFQLISFKDYDKKGSRKGYNGSKNVNFIGKGKVIFDMGYRQPGVSIVMGHNQNVKISGITFQNLGAHAIELDASKNVTIEKCTFKNGKSEKKTTEAINLDVPDDNTGGFSFKWSSMDKTPNKNITIQNCTFDSIPRGIGTHKYSQKNGKNVMHTNIKILNNKFTNMTSREAYAITPLNWSKVTIEGNTITGADIGIYGYGGLRSANIKNNKFSKVGSTIVIHSSWSTQEYPSGSATTFLNKAQKKLLSTNKYVKGTVSSPDAQIPGGSVELTEVKK